MSQAVGASADAKQRNRRARELRHPKNFIKVHKRAKTRKLAETSACFEVYKLCRFIERSSLPAVLVQTQCVLKIIPRRSGYHYHEVTKVHYLSAKTLEFMNPRDHSGSNSHYPVPDTTPLWLYGELF